MPSVATPPSGGASDSNANALVPFTPDSQLSVVYPLKHSLKPPISRVSICFARGNTLRISIFSDSTESEIGGKVMEVKLGSNSSGDTELKDTYWRKIAYGSVSPYALLQSRRNALDLSNLQLSPSPYHLEWWEYVMDYSKDISLLLGNPKSDTSPAIEDPKEVLKKGEEQPTCLKAAWDLMEMFYADKLSQSWLPERLVDWLSDYDSLLSDSQATVYMNLMAFQEELVGLQVVEDDPKYWEVISSALAVGWLEIAVKLLRLHGSYQLDQLGSRETENGLVETVAILITKMPRMRPELQTGKLGECFKAKPDFTKGLESMYGLTQKCIQLKPYTNQHKLMQLILGILGENTEVILAECSRSFGPWMMTHASELMTAGSVHAEMILLEERDNLGGISIDELNRLVYAQVLSSHILTWHIAPIYLMACMKLGIGLLEILLYRQPVQHNELLIKNLETCRLNNLDSISGDIMKIAGVYHWKHGRKGSGVHWLRQARDEVCLNRIAQQLFDSVGKSISDENLKQWEGSIELLGSESKPAGGLEFLHKFRDFKKSLKQVFDGKSTDAAQAAVESLLSLIKNPSTPQRFWLPLLHDSLKLLSWEEGPLLNVTQTNLLLNKLQELSMARLRPNFVEVDLPPQALSSVRLALATNLGRAILEEP